VGNFSLFSFLSPGGKGFSSFLKNSNSRFTFPAKGGDKFLKKYFSLSFGVFLEHKDLSIKIGIKK
jgi:hypothetical protein